MRIATSSKIWHTQQFSATGLRLVQQQSQPLNSCRSTKTSLVSTQSCTCPQQRNALCGSAEIALFSQLMSNKKSPLRHNYHLNIARFSEFWQFGVQKTAAMWWSAQYNCSSTEHTERSKAQIIMQALLWQLTHVAQSTMRCTALAAQPTFCTGRVKINSIASRTQFSWDRHGVAMSDIFNNIT